MTTFCVCMDELALLRSINVISEGNDVTPCNGEVLYVLLSGSCFHCLNLKTVVPEIRDKKIRQTHVVVVVFFLIGIHPMQG